jgi:hypothetical protein
MASMIRANDLSFFSSMFHNHVAARLSYRKPTIPFKQPYQLAELHLLLYTKP